MNMLDNDNHPQEVKTDILTVKNNIIEFKDYFITISNISEAEVAPIPKLQYPTAAVVLSIVGIVLFLMGIRHVATLPVAIMGLILCAIGGLIMYRIYQKNQDRGEVLILGLNSGRRFYFQCYDKAFLRTVLNALKSCVNTKNQSITFDLRESKITNSPIINGDDNTVRVEV